MSVLSEADLDAVFARLRFVTGKKKDDAGVKIAGALCEPPEMSRGIDQAATLSLVLHDPDRVIVRSELARRRSWVKTPGDVRFELVGIAKAGQRVTLTYEDAIVAQLRRQTDKLSIKANTLSRAGIAQRLAKEAGVALLVDPGHPEKVHSAIARSAGKDKTNSWDLLGTDVAEPINWRRFSDGRRLVLGSDDWLLKRDSEVTRIREATGPFGFFDFDLDVGARVSAATLEVDADLWALPPGSAVRVDDLGAANGRWLVSAFDRNFLTTRGTVSLVRPRHELEEPPPPPKREAAGERGEDGYVPGKEGASDGGTAPAATAARTKFVNFALAQKGDSYVWGGNGPSGWDCSGLVQGAAAFAGRPLAKPSANQAAVVARSGRGCSVETAIRTRGALLFRMGSPYNHVAISLGNGQTIEAMGTAYGVCIGNAAGRGWTSAGIWI